MCIYISHELSYCCVDIFEFYQGVSLWRPLSARADSWCTTLFRHIHCQDQRGRGTWDTRHKD